MEVEEKKLTFFLFYEGCETTLQFSEYDTVEILKKEVHRIFGIPPHKQEIHGWTNTPECDNTILQFCTDQNDFMCCLVVCSKENEVSLDRHELTFNNNYDAEDLEVEAALSFINKTCRKKINSSVIFHSCTLENALTSTCLAPLERKKILLLYLHNEDDRFSSIFYENLKNCDVASMLNRSFFLLGWDITETKYQSALIGALNKCAELSNLTSLLKFKSSAALFIMGINDSVVVWSVMKGEVSNKDFLDTLDQIEKCYIAEINQEEGLKQLNEVTKSENDIGSVQYQKLMADLLGDRDYDSFEFDEHEHLKNKIAYAINGPPKEEKGYDEKEMQRVNRLYKIILNNSNEIAKYKDKVEISFIYNCTEPLPSEKIRRSKKYKKDYNPNTDLCPVPIFILRKCHGSKNPCRIFIDDLGRRYEKWEEYITRNKLHKCQMILPYNGRYEVDSNGEVLLERHLSPACSIHSKVLQTVDQVNIAGGMISGGILATATISTVFAPAVVVTAGVTCLGMGIYSIGRSAYTLYDRSRHKESLSFDNSEARGAYLNILAGSLGFVGAGATVAVSHLASQGVNIGKGASAVFNTIGYANIGASGASLLNSGYDVYDQWYNQKQKPSLLTVIQLSSSVLFFGNAVYNFKTCSTLVDEAQTRILQDYQESLRSNRHRKTLTKLLKETIRQNNGNEIRGRAEVISALCNIQNKDEVFAVLTRSNKDMNKNGLKFSAVNGEISLNGIQIDITEFMGMNKREAKTFLLNLSKSEPTPAETMSMKRLISNTLNNISVPNAESFATYTLKLLNCCNTDTKTKIIGALAKIIATFTEEIIQDLDKLFPNNQKFFKLMDMIVNFFGKAADNLEDQYQKWQKTKDDRDYSPCFKNANMDEIRRAIHFFQYAVDLYFKVRHFREEALKELLRYFYNWLSSQVFEYQKKIERDTKRREYSAGSPTKKIPCSLCGGYYFLNVSKNK